MSISESELKTYAKLNNTTVSEIIENEYDLDVFKNYETERQLGTLKTRPINKLWEELGL